MRDKKHLVEHSNKLAEKAKLKAMFRTQRKPVEAGAHGTLNYTAIQFYVLNDSPHPQRSVSLGFLNINVDENCSFL